jgi:copper chaperone NosL
MKLPARSLCLVALLLAACTPATPHLAAQEPNADTACSLDGMMLRDFPGPKAQIQYAEGAPDYFCDVMELFALVLAAEQKRNVAALYVQDMSQAEWAHPAGHWIDARTAYYVVDSRKTGSMGPTFGSFGTEAAAKAFAAAEGGRVLRFEQINRDMVSMSGGAAHDNAMSH